MQDFINFVAEIMEVDPATLNASTAYKSIPQWDSLMHMRLVMEVEEEYDVEIPIDKMAELTTLAAIYDYIEAGA